MSEEAAAAKRLPLRLKLLYSTGDLTTSGSIAIVMFFQLYFMTDVAGLRPDLAGWALAAGRVWDAINDPLFGLLSDRIRSKWGRRRVLLLLGALPLGVAFFLMWMRPDFGPIGLTVYYALTFIIYDTAYTAIHVGYNSLTPELTTDYDERSSLNGYRMTYALFGSLGGIVLATVLGWYIMDKRMLFVTISLLLGVVYSIPPLIVFGVTKEYRSNAPSEQISLLESLKYTVSSRPFLMLMAIYLLSWTTFSILSAVLLYFANYYMRVPDQANYFVLTAQASAIIFIPLSVKLAQWFDKRRAFIIGSVSWIIALLGIASLQPDQVTLGYVLAAMSGLGIATAYVIPWSMMPDVIEYDQLRTGERREGSYYALAAFFQKLGTGAALWAMSQALALTGYINPDTSTQILPTQPPEALRMIRLFTGPIPAALLVIAILFAWWYPITREAHQLHLDQLADMDA